MLVRCIVVCVICALIVAVSANEELTDETLIQDLIQWVIAKGGVFNRKMEIRRSNPRDPNSHLAMFAQDDIPENELLLEIPRSVLITAGDDKGEYGGLWCPTVRNLIAELKKGDESEFAPYVKYLKRQPPGQLPSAWSDAGKDLLLELLAQNDDDDFNDVRPADAIGWIDNEWKQDCQGSDDAFEQHVAMLLVQRGWDDLAIPLFDMMSHRNGRWHNTKSNSVHKKSTNIKVKASRDIKAGEEIYSSYNFCKDCANKAKGEYGTPEILRDYGFVENYPQRWFFGRRLSFEIDQIYDEDDMPTGEFTINWLDKKPKKKAIRWLVKTLDHLNDFEAMELESVDKDIPPGELTVIKAFHKALMNAIQMALKHWKVEIQQLSGDCKEGDDSCALSARYDDLGWRPDDLGYAVYTCDTSVSMSYKGFEKLESFKSHYQKVDFWKDPKNDNVCLDISNIIQMCGSYRPHYHEMVVHYPARYIDTIKRVLWVGGGDSMLLHEILKYPSLEFVVGLELDQTITRYSFKHFGTQPHFDNEKVQWWYGDAAKSLLLLPADYFGSFDMVLVDLSETVMSFLVTDKLDIMQALSLLIKPDGIMVKNELYMEQMAEIFDYRYVALVHFGIFNVLLLTLGNGTVSRFTTRVFP
jgi:spermidine synthase